MTQFLFNNFAQVLLEHGVDEDETTFSVDPAAAGVLPVPGVGQAFVLILWDGTSPQEIVYCSANPLDGTLTVSRGEEDTSNRAWPAGTQMRNFLTRDTLGNVILDSFMTANKASTPEAVAGVDDSKFMTPAKTQSWFAARSTTFGQDMLLAADQVEGRSLLGWESTVFSGTGIETTFSLPDPSWNNTFTKVYVDETFVPTSDYSWGSFPNDNQLIFDTPPVVGTGNITVVKGINFAFSVSFPGANTVDTPAIVDGAVTTSKLHDAAVTTAKLNDKAVTYGKMQDVSATDKVLGRASVGSGPVEEIDFKATARAVGSAASLAAAQSALTSNAWPVPSGMIGHFFCTSAPGGWVDANSGTIGSSGSGAGYANDNALDLFTTLWNGTSNTDLVIQTSTGTPTTRGANAAADWAANKRLPTPDLRGVVVRGMDLSRGLDAGRALASQQSDAIKSHSATFTGNAMGAVSVSVSASLGGRFGANHYAASSDTPAWSSGDSTWGSGSTSFGGATAGLGTPTGSVSYSGAAETRMANAAARACLKL